MAVPTELQKVFPDYNYKYHVPLRPYATKRTTPALKAAPPLLRKEGCLKMKEQGDKHPALYSLFWQ
jgi:hypothetical protein